MSSGTWVAMVVAFTVVLAACSSGSGTNAASDALSLPTQERGAPDLPGDSGTIEGIVVAVDGTLADVAGFRIVLSDGTDATLVPAAGVQFDGIAPLSHLRDHLASGEPVRVRYLRVGDGTFSAVEVGDG